MNWFNYFILIVLSCLFLGCKKQNERACFKTSGKLITRSVIKGDFSYLILHPYVEYELVQDSLNYVEITCGENLFPFIDIQVKDSNLTITNKNTCRFLRGYDKNVKAKIHINLLYNLYYDGSENLFSKDTIKASFCTIMMQDAGGNINLNLKCKELSVKKSNALGILELSGKTNKAHYVNTSVNKFDVSKLEVRDSIYFLNQGYGDMYLYTNLIDVYGRLENIGNVYFFGKPALTQVENIGKGKIIEN